MESVLGWEDMIETQERINRDGISYQRIYGTFSIAYRNSSLTVEPEHGFSPSRQDAEEIYRAFERLVSKYKSEQWAKIVDDTVIDLSFPNEGYCIYIVPLSRRPLDEQSQLCLVILERGQYHSKENRESLKKFGHLLEFLCCGIHDIETSLSSAAVFHKHLDAIFSSDIDRGANSTAVILLRVEDTHSVERKRTVAHGIRHWLEDFKGTDSVVVSRYDGLSYAIAMPIHSVKDKEQGVRNHVTVLVEQYIGPALRVDGAVTPPVYAGIILIDGDVRPNTQYVVDAALEAMREAERQSQSMHLVNVADSDDADSSVP